MLGKAILNSVLSISRIRSYVWHLYWTILDADPKAPSLHNSWRAIMAHGHRTEMIWDLKDHGTGSWTNRKILPASLAVCIGAVRRKYDL